jgi:hypothetical protein
MGRCVEIISGKAVNPGATFTALTMATGDSATVRAMASGSAFMHDIWAQEATAGVVRVRSPRMHDNLQNIRTGIIAASPRPTLPDEFSQPLYSQDVMTLDMTGGGAETDAASFFMDYDDVGGINARLASWEEIKPRVVSLVSIETQHTTGGTAGDYGGSLAINSFEDILKANLDYALLGYKVSAAVLSVGYKGADTGNVRIGGPGTTQEQETRNWFIRMSKNTGRPMIPILNAANKFGFFVDLISTATGASVNVWSIFAQLQ